jgi:hypothetical protein
MQSIKNGMKKVAPALALAVAVAGLQGCTDAEIQAGVGLVAIGAGIAIIADAADDNHQGDHHHGHYVCQSGYVRHCHDYRDYYGRLRRECSEHYESCAHQVWRSDRSFDNSLRAAQDGVISLQSVKEAKLSTELWAETFEMGFEGAATLVNALQAARDGHGEKLADLGLASEDVRALAHYKMISNEGLDALAQSLDLDVESTQKLLQRLIDKAVEIQDTATAR